MCQYCQRRETMSETSAILTALGICAIAAILEGLAAGKNVKPYFAKLRWPAYSPPLWVWYIIGALYYAICFLILYRLLRHSGDAVLKQTALALIVALMIANALWNYVFFRAQNLRLSFASNIPYLGLAIAIFFCLVQIDQAAAWSLAPYLIYQGYALWWGYSLWKINDRVE